MNVKLLKINVMKKILFTLMMIAVMAMVANTAKAQGTAQNPYPGGTYDYNLNGVYTSATDATATISWTGLAETGVITTSHTEVTANVAYTIDGTTDHVFDFQVTYDMAETAGAKTLTVTITDGTGGCTNFINLAITVQSAPSIALQITAATDITCQNLGTPGDNEDAATAVGGTPPAANQLVFTVTPTPSAGVTTYTYDFNFNLDDWTFGATNLTVTAVSSGSFASGTTGYDITGATGAVTVTVEFTTTTNQAQQDFAATISDPVLTVATVDYTAGNSITAPTAGNNVSTITYTPAIGAFSF